MINICKTSFVFFLILMGCHSGHHGESSKSKYLKSQKMNQAKVETKKVLDKNEFLEWRADNDEEFLVSKVWAESKEQSCKECHQNYALTDIKGDEHPRSHWNISLVHANIEIMNCQTCHSKTEVWKFNGMQSPVDANQTAQLCAQCHYKQKRDWETGAHGKSAVGWQYEKAIYNCVSCHNPHSPSFKKLWPKVAPYRPKNNEER